MDESTAPQIRRAAVSLDCADPVVFAQFHVALLGGEMLWNSDGSAGVRIGASIVLVSQRVADYVPPAWPGTSIVHLARIFHVSFYGG